MMSTTGLESSENPKVPSTSQMSSRARYILADESVTGPARAVRDRKQTTPRSHEGRDAAL